MLKCNPQGKLLVLEILFTMHCRKSYIAAGYSLPLSGSALITVGGIENKEKILPLVSMISRMNFRILATEHTAEFFEKSGIKKCRFNL